MPFLEASSKQKGKELEDLVRVEVETGVRKDSAEIAVSSEDEEVEGAAENTPEHESSDPQNALRDYMLARDRTRRRVKPSSKYSDAEYVLHTLCIAEKIEYSEPVNFKEAMASNESK